MTVAFAIALDQFGIVEIIAGEAQDTLRQPLAQFDFFGVVKQRNLDAFDLLFVITNDREHRLKCLFEGG
jgi:hypothetical protein